MSFTTRTCWRAVIYVARYRSSTRWSWRPSRPSAVARRSPCTAPCWALRGRVWRLGPTWAPAAEGSQSQAQVSLPRGICPASSLALWAKVSHVLRCSTDVWLFSLTRQFFFFFASFSVCTQLLVSRSDEDNISSYLQLIDKCLIHEVPTSQKPTNITYYEINNGNRHDRVFHADIWA